LTTTWNPDLPQNHFLASYANSSSGFCTTKGELVRSILFPPPLDFKFHSDFLKSIYVFLSLGLIGMAYSLYMWIKNGVSWYYGLIMTLN
jgi:cation-transporting ATPase 13A2